MPIEAIDEQPSMARRALNTTARVGWTVTKETTKVTAKTAWWLTVVTATTAGGYVASKFSKKAAEKIAPKNPVESLVGGSTATSAAILAACWYANLPIATLLANDTIRGIFFAPVIRDFVFMGVTTAGVLIFHSVKKTDEVGSQRLYITPAKDEQSNLDVRVEEIEHDHEAPTA